MTEEEEDFKAPVLPESELRLQLAEAKIHRLELMLAMTLKVVFGKEALTTEQGQALLAAIQEINRERSSDETQPSTVWERLTRDG